MKSRCMGLLGTLLALAISFFGCGGGGGGGGTTQPPASPPSAPTNLVATAGDSIVGLSWTAVSGATSYNVYRGIASGALGTKTKIAPGLTNPAYNDTTATNGTTYYYQVTAVNAAGESGGSSEKSAMPQATLPPVAPTNLVATAGDSTVGLTWTAVPGATSYNVYRGTATGALSTKTNIASGLVSAIYNDATVTNGMIYYYQVTAVNAIGESGGSTEKSAMPRGAGSWTATNRNGAPSARAAHSSCWTGTEILIWGGTDDGVTGLNTGGRYDPATDSWTAINTVGAPSARFEARMHWIGLTVNRMIVWGGTNDNYTTGLNTGGVYDPASNSWTATTTTNAPTGRFYHTMTRSGSKVIVWGGSPDDTNGLNTGGVYDPVGNSWTATNTAGAPSARFLHKAVRRGSAETMIVWGGDDGINVLNTGGIYDPAGDTWTPTNTVGAPVARANHSAVFAPNIGMIVWGGTPDYTTNLNTGGIYHATADTWTAISTVNAPSARDEHTAEWTGTEMIVWGGSPNYTTSNTLNTGGRYDPVTNTWIATTTVNAPSARGAHKSDWTGTEMIIWGGTPDYSTTVLDTGGRYTP